MENGVSVEQIVIVEEGGPFGIKGFLFVGIDENDYFLILSVPLID